MKFLRQRFTEKQSLQATASQFYGILNYGLQVWLILHTQNSVLRKGSLLIVDI